MKLLILYPIFIGLFIFLPAGSFRFWEGWLYIIPLIGIASLALILFEFLKRNRSWVPPLSYLAAYIAVPLVAAVFLLSPQALWLNLSDSFGFLSKAGETGGDFWPNLRRLVSETNAPSAASWFFLLGPETLLFGVLGLFAAGSSFLKEKTALLRQSFLFRSKNEEHSNVELRN